MLSDVRRKLKKEIEAETLFSDPLFDVWINEDAPPAEGNSDSWEHCLKQVERADLVLVLYNGNSGWAKDGGDIGICHEELHTALSVAPAKVRLIELPEEALRPGVDGQRDRRFRRYKESQNLFRSTAQNAEQLVARCREALREAVAQMTQLGVWEARKGKFYTGAALEWSHMDLLSRRAAMTNTLRAALLGHSGAVEDRGHVLVPIENKPVLMVCHGMPAAFSVAAAREMVGQPFLRDHEFATVLDASQIGPVHLIACNRSVTESQAMKQLGFADATFVSPPFGVYVADNVQKIQLAFIANCRDETTTRHGVQRFFAWLEQSGERHLLVERAAARKRIVKAIAREASLTQPTPQMAKRRGASQ